MTEPTTSAVVATTSLAAIAVAKASVPELGGMLTILACAVAGGALQLSTVLDPLTGKPYTRLAAAWYLLTTAGMAFALTGAIVYALERWLSLPAEIIGLPVAFLIGARREWVLSKITGLGDKALPSKKEQE